jgi:hypothetical protein
VPFCQLCSRMETFVGPRNFDGSGFEAARWHDLGMTTGESLVRSKKVTGEPEEDLCVQAGGGFPRASLFGCFNA